jgi:hypothetical protein
MEAHTTALDDGKKLYLSKTPEGHRQDLAAVVAIAGVTRPQSTGTVGLDGFSR